MKHRELIEKISPKELKKTVYLSQLLFLFIGIGLAFVFFDRIEAFTSLFIFDLEEIFYYGVLLAFVLIIIELILYNAIDQKHFDDGGINEKLFRNQSVGSIFFIALTVAICEELLFRGVIQTTFGYLFASSLFVVLHTRYLKKPVLLGLLIVTSFLIGFIFEVTSNLLVTITFHFVVDFVLGLYIKFSK
ncbi:MAG TPA: type II CAAX endopeptidase family protein [Pseudogracilibacillus sp.]|nr:type II CAAX endopeptidase family protein [Pseudogracilibacillus sp.]